MKNNKTELFRNIKISLVTVSFNSDEFIARCLRSVVNNLDFLHEYIIIDNNSSDSTIKIIKSFNKSFNGKLKLISEPDKGIYDAINKGIKVSEGDIVGILHSDLEYYENPLGKIIHVFETTNCDFFYADAVSYDLKSRKSIINSKSNMSYRPHIFNPLLHTTLYMKTDLAKKNPYSLTYKISSDYNQILKLLSLGLNSYYYDKPIVCIYSTGITTDLPYLGAIETAKINIDNFGYFTSFFHNFLIMLYAVYLYLKISTHRLLS